jgi:hypothetical protein
VQDVLPFVPRKKVEHAGPKRQPVPDVSRVFNQDHLATWPQNSMNFSQQGHSL